MLKPRKLIYLFFLLLPFHALKGQLLINEFCASNSSIITDADNGEYTDWIELYNNGNDPVNLNGFSITDNLNNLDKYIFAIDTFVPPKGYIVLWMDGLGESLHPGFKLAQEGETIGLVTAEGILTDSVSYSGQMVNISMGRKDPNGREWVYYLDPTPGTENSTATYNGFVFHVPQFSVRGGFFDVPIEVSMETLMEGIVRYTLDGSEPSATSPAYSSPVKIDSTKVLRARVFVPGLIPGRIITHSYFIGENFESRGLPVVSIATNPENFWDSETGIYVQDFKPYREVPINIEMFENNGSDRAVFNSPAGTKINGLYSWQLPQKMLGIYFRKQYGENKLENQLFFEKPRTNFKDFALRASGSDWSYTLFRDKLGQSAIADVTQIDYMAFKTCIVYVNGEYLGIHNIREKVNKNYIEGNYGLKSGTFDIIENETYVEEGSLDAYKACKHG